MELILRVHRPTVSGAERYDVRLDAEVTHTVSDVVRTLCATLNAPQFDQAHLLTAQGPRALAMDHTMAMANLVSGDVLVLGPIPTSGADQAMTVGRQLTVISGVDTGRAVSLSAGNTYAVGRDATNDLVLADPQVSRYDVALIAEHDGSMVLDPGQDRSNEVRVGGRPVAEPTPVADGDVIQLGASTLVVRTVSGAPLRALDAFGAVPYHRTPYLFEPIPDREFKPLGRIPVKPTPRRFQYLATVAPLVTAVLLALVLGRPQYLLFAAMSPVIAIAGFFDARRSGGNQYKQDVETFEERFVTRIAEVDDALAEERRIRTRNAPDTVHLVAQAQAYRQLWERSRDSDDFLRLRIGLGDVSAALTVEPERQGDEDLRARVDEAMAERRELVDVPATVALRRDGTLALLGPRTETTLVATSLAIQAACLHSPEDLVIVAAVDDDTQLNEQLKWLPHVRSRNSPLAGDHLAGDRESAQDLLREVMRVAGSRAGSRDRQLDLRWPWILMVIDQRLEPDPSLVAELLDLGPSVGVSVLWLTEAEHRVPRQADIIAQLYAPTAGVPSTLTYVDPSRAEQYIEPDRLRLDYADQAARALAPLIDATAVRAAASVPSVVTLFDALGIDEITPEWVAEQWLIDRGYQLTTPVGLTETGPLTLDLRHHGPHGLIGGTSGAGKSELVQSLVANLVATNSPERVNLLFVDYKGGALSGMFAEVPHTVGAVTNLDALEALRALTSLRAELDRRMRLFGTKPDARDLRDMLERYPDEAPPALVIVVDEFAALVRELPEFVDGVVSIAERGRSLGIHLLLSTQRPSGSINENIQQNTNLRIALRMLDSGESTNVIGSPEAATIPAHMKGRAYGRLGPGELVAFQSAWSGAPLHRAHGRPVSVTAFTSRSAGGTGLGRAPSPASAAASTETQLDALITAVTSAAQRLDMGPGPAPWQEPLPHLVPLTDVLRDTRSTSVDVPGQRVTVGMVDDPEAQDQYPLSLDLIDSGGVVIYGNGGSGKTTTLQTIAASAAVRDHQHGGGTLTIVGFDFASRQLRIIDDLPQSAGVANGDDTEHVTRMLAMLQQLFTERRQAVADAVAHRTEMPSFPTVLMLVDGYDNMADAMLTGASSVLAPWFETASTLITQGRQVGIVAAVATTAFTGPSARLMNTMGNRIVHRQTDDNVYRVFGVPAAIATGLVLQPGQAMTRSANVMHVAALCRTGHDGAPVFAPDAIEVLGAQLTNGRVEASCVSEILPIEIRESLTIKDGGLRVAVGRADLSGDLEHVNLDINPFVVVGPRRSGRSTALCTIGRQLLDAGHHVVAVGPRGSRLAEIDDWASSAFGRADDVMPALEALGTEATSFGDRARFLLFDDADLFDDNSLNGPLKAILDAEVRCVGSAVSSRNLSTTNPVQRLLRGATSLLALKAEDETAITAALGPRFRLRPGVPMVPGRGLLATDGRPSVIQVVDVL